MRTCAYTRGMRRSLLVVLLVVSAFWQVLTVGGRPGGLSAPRETAHAMLHWQGQTHHHHDDGSVAQDSSKESVQHVALDGVLALNATWSEPSVSLPLAELAPPASRDEICSPWPYLDGPRHPPKLAA